MTNDQDNMLHETANHEANLNVNRPYVFISLNGFFAVAVGLVKDPVVSFIFSGMVLLVDLVWARWAGNARIFMRALRDAGTERPDEQLWQRLIGRREHGIANSLAITSVYIPWVLTLGWLLISGYFLLLLLHVLASPSS